MNDASSLGPEAARHRATVATRAGLRVVSLLDHVLEQQPQDTCFALRSLKRTLRAAQLNPLSLIETPVLQMALTQLQIIDDGGDPRVGNLARNLELYLALRRIRAASEAVSAFDDDATVSSHQRPDVGQTTISGLDVIENAWAEASRFQDSPFINQFASAKATGFRDTVIDQSLAPSSRSAAMHSSRGRTVHLPGDGFPDTVQDFAATVPAALA